MQPFRDLVKPNSKFKWTPTMQRLFEESKQKLIEQSIEGIRTYDPARTTCLQMDWSKDGIGYLLFTEILPVRYSEGPGLL